MELRLPAACPKIDHHLDTGLLRRCWADGCLRPVPEDEAQLGLCPEHHRRLLAGIPRARLAPGG